MQKRDNSKGRKRSTRNVSAKSKPTTTGKRINKSKPASPSEESPKKKYFKKKYDSKKPTSKSSTYNRDEKTDDFQSKPYKRNVDSKRKDNSSESSRFTEKRANESQNRPFKKSSGHQKPVSVKASSSNSKKNVIKGGDKTRLNKFISNAGICSRREADEYIKAGLVSVNGKIIIEMGFTVVYGDEVKFNDERIRSEKKIYLLLNKPKDFVSTLADEHAEKDVMDLVKNACQERIYPVGKLDKNTTGLLLFTNDGDLVKRLTDPKYKKKKIYQVNLDKSATRAHLSDIAAGIELEDGFIQSDAISFPDAADKKIVGIEIRSGKNRIVRRLFEHFGYKVTKLDRVYYAGLTKKNLPRGTWRFLSLKEINMLNMNAFE